LGFPSAIEKRLNGRRLAFLSIESEFKTLGDQALA
jgi:hypothetical protein